MQKYNETCKAERKSATTPDPLQHLPMFVEDIAKITLTPLDEKRLETIMADDDTSPHPYTTFANGRLSEIDKYAPCLYIAKLTCAGNSRHTRMKQVGILVAPYLQHQSTALVAKAVPCPLYTH